MGALLNLVGIGTGVALYAMLLVMVLRAPAHARQRTGADRVLVAASVLGLVWNGCALPLYGFPHGPKPGDLLGWLAVVGFAALGCLPAVVVHSVLRDSHDLVRGWFKRTLVVVAYSASLLAAVVQVGAWRSGNPVPAPLAMRLLTWVFVALVLPVAVATRKQPGSRRALWIVALAAFTVSALHLMQIHSAQDSWLAELLGHHASVVLAVAILYQDYPFAFADLFLKRALTLTALVAAALSGVVAFGLPANGSEGPVLVGPRQIGVVVSLWIGTALLYPWLRRAVAWFVDVVVLRRPDYRSLRATIASRIDRHDEVDALLDDVCGLVAPALNARLVEWRALPAPSPVGEPRSLVAVIDGSVAVDIPTSDTPRYALVGGPLVGGRRLLSDDVSMLEWLAVALARRIDAIRLTEERYERELREQEIDRLATEAELRELRAQINPHFLFNALTTIGYLIQTAPSKAFGTLMRLTTLLRSVLRSEGEFTTLGHELDIVESYLDIERARFEDRLRVHVEVPDRLRDVLVPPLLLQPLVENAVKHGIGQKRWGGDVTVRAAHGPDGTGGGVLRLSVEDTGAGTTEVALAVGKREGVGLRNIERRLACQFGGQASLDVRSMPGLGTVAEIRLPAALWTELEASTGGAR